MMVIGVLAYSQYERRGNLRYLHLRRISFEPGSVHLKLREEVLAYAGLEERGGEEKLFEAVEVLAYAPERVLRFQVVGGVRDDFDVEVLRERHERER